MPWGSHLGERHTRRVWRHILLTLALARRGRMPHQVPNETHQWGLKTASTSPGSTAGSWVDLIRVLPPYPRGQPCHPVPQGLAKNIPSAGLPYLLPCLRKSYSPSSLCMAPCSRKPVSTAPEEVGVPFSPCHEAWSCEKSETQLWKPGFTSRVTTY